MYKQVTRTYQKVALESAPPAKVLDLLYERLLQDIDHLAEAIREKDFAQRSKMFDHALRIIEAFRVSLDYSQANELCSQLDAMYDYISYQLQNACIQQSEEPLEHAKKSLRTLQEAFQKAANER